MRNFFSVAMLVSVIAIAINHSALFLILFGALFSFSALYVLGDIKYENDAKRCEQALKHYELKRRHRIY